MIDVCKFSDEGLNVFSSIILRERKRVKSATQPSYVGDDFFKEVYELAMNEKYVELLDSPAKLDFDIKYETRYEMGEYLNKVLPATSEIGISNIGLWSWLAAIYMKDICEYDAKKEKWKLWSEYRYLQDEDKRRSYRHLISTSVLTFRELGTEAARLFLSTEPYIMGDAVEQLRSRAIDFSSNPTAVLVANELYISPETKRLKKNAMGKKGGSARRLVEVVMKQLSMNFDLYSLEPEAFLKILPPEFDSWKEV